MTIDIVDLVKRLLFDVALTGSRGLGAKELETKIERHYNDRHSEALTAASNDEVLNDTSTEAPSANTTEDLAGFTASVWQQIEEHPDFTVLREKEDASAQPQVTNGEPGPANTTTTSSRPTLVRASKEQIWQAIAGHSVDKPRIAPMMFDLLEVVAAAGPDGILQPEARRLAGQDKTSVPGRTDGLAARGYITKERISVPSMITSRLRLWRFAGKDTETPEKESQEPENFDHGAVFDTMVSLLKSNGGIATLKDVQLETECTEYLKRKSLGRCIGRAEKTGLIRKVKAKVEDEEGINGTDRVARCLQLIKEPSGKDRQAFIGIGGPAKLDANGRTRGQVALDSGRSRPRRRHVPKGGLDASDEENDEEDDREQQQPATQKSKLPAPAKKMRNTDVPVADVAQAERQPKSRPPLAAVKSATPQIDVATPSIDAGAHWNGVAVSSADAVAPPAEGQHTPYSSPARVAPAASQVDAATPSTIAGRVNSTSGSSNNAATSASNVATLWKPSVAAPSSSATALWNSTTAPSNMTNALWSNVRAPSNNAAALWNSTAAPSNRTAALWNHAAAPSNNTTALQSAAVPLSQMQPYFPPARLNEAPTPNDASISPMTAGHLLNNVANPSTDGTAFPASAATSSNIATHSSNDTVAGPSDALRSSQAAELEESPRPQKKRRISKAETQGVKFVMEKPASSRVDLTAKREAPEIYFRPPTPQKRRRGRPRKSLIAVVKTDKLRDQPWFQGEAAGGESLQTAGSNSAPALQDGINAPQPIVPSVGQSTLVSGHVTDNLTAANEQPRQLSKGSLGQIRRHERERAQKAAAAAAAQQPMSEAQTPVATTQKAPLAAPDVLDSRQPALQSSPQPDDTFTVEALAEAHRRGPDGVQSLAEKQQPVLSPPITEVTRQAPPSTPQQTGTSIPVDVASPPSAEEAAQAGRITSRELQASTAPETQLVPTTSMAAQIEAVSSAPEAAQDLAEADGSQSAPAAPQEGAFQQNETGGTLLQPESSQMSAHLLAQRRRRERERAFKAAMGQQSAISSAPGAATYTPKIRKPSRLKQSLIVKLSVPKDQLQSIVEAVSDDAGTTGQDDIGVNSPVDDSEIGDGDGLAQISKQLKICRMAEPHEAAAFDLTLADLEGLPDAELVPFEDEEYAEETAESSWNPNRRVIIKSSPMHLERCKVLLDIVRTAGGVFPGVTQMWYAFTSKWLQTHPGTPESRTVQKVIHTLRSEGRLNKYAFKWRKNGTWVTQHVLTEPQIGPASLQLKKCQRMMILLHPDRYMPAEIEMSDDLRKQGHFRAIPVAKTDKKRPREESVQPESRKRRRMSTKQPAEDELGMFDAEQLPNDEQVGAGNEHPSDVEYVDDGVEPAEDDQEMVDDQASDDDFEGEKASTKEARDWRQNFKPVEGVTVKRTAAGIDFANSEARRNGFADARARVQANTSMGKIPYLHLRRDAMKAGQLISTGELPPTSVKRRRRRTDSADVEELGSRPASSAAHSMINAGASPAMATPKKHAGWPKGVPRKPAGPKQPKVGDDIGPLLSLLFHPQQFLHWPSGTVGTFSGFGIEPVRAVPKSVGMVSAVRKTPKKRAADELTYGASSSAADLLMAPGQVLHEPTWTFGISSVIAQPPQVEDGGRGKRIKKSTEKATAFSKMQASGTFNEVFGAPFLPPAPIAGPKLSSLIDDPENGTVSTEYVKHHPDELWYHRGHGRWARQPAPAQTSWVSKGMGSEETFSTEYTKQHPEETWYHHGAGRWRTTPLTAPRRSAAEKSEKFDKIFTVSTEYVNQHPEEQWYHRGGGRWAKFPSGRSAAYFATQRPRSDSTSSADAPFEIDEEADAPFEIDAEADAPFEMDEDFSRMGTPSGVFETDQTDSATPSVPPTPTTENATPTSKSRRGADLGERITTAYVNAHPNETFWHRGHGSWERGLPPPGATYKTAVKGPGAKEYLASIDTKEGKSKKHGPVQDGLQLKLNGQPWKNQPITVNGVIVNPRKHLPPKSRPSWSASGGVTVRYEVPTREGQPGTATGTFVLPPSPYDDNGGYGAAHSSQTGYTPLLSGPAPIRQQGEPYPGTSGLSQPPTVQRKRPYTYKSRKQLSAVGVDGVPIELDRDSDDDYMHSSSPKRQRTSLLMSNGAAKTKIDRKKLTTAVALVMNLSPAATWKDARWDLVGLALRSNDRGAAAEMQYRSIANHGPHNQFAEALREQLQEPFLAAMEKGELPDVDLACLARSDWSGLLRWAEKNVVHLVPEAPTEIVEKGKPGRKPKPGKKQKPKVKQPIVNTAAVYPATYNLQPKAPLSDLDPKEDLIMAKSWIRANSTTKDEMYNTGQATEKLTAIGPPIIQAVEEMQKSNSVRQLKAGRQRPGRNFEITKHVWEQFQRWPGDAENEGYLRKLTQARTEVLQHFAVNETLEMTEHVSEQKVLILSNLLAQGVLKMEVKLPERNDDIDAPFPKLNAWSYCGPRHDTRKIDRAVFDLPIVYTRTDTFSTEHSLKTDIPTPGLPQARPNEHLPRVPFWIDIHGNVVQEIWEKVVSSVAYLLVRRPGVTAKGIEKAHANKLWAWEVEMVLEWMGKVGVAERFGAGREGKDGVWEGGWGVGEEWYCVFGEVGRM